MNFALIHFLGEGQIVWLKLVETSIQIFVIIVIPVGIGMIIRHSELAIAPAIYCLLMFFTGGIAIYFGLRRARAAAELSVRSS